MSSSQNGSGDDRVHGEGNYEAARRFDEAEKRFVQSGQVERAAREARPESPAVQRELEQAEQAGRARSRGEDRAADDGKVLREAPVDALVARLSRCDVADPEFARIVDELAGRARAAAPR